MNISAMGKFLQAAFYLTACIILSVPLSAFTACAGEAVRFSFGETAASSGAEISKAQLSAAKLANTIWEHSFFEEDALYAHRIEFQKATGNTVALSFDWLKNGESIYDAPWTFTYNTNTCVISDVYELEGFLFVNNDFMYIERSYEKEDGSKNVPGTWTCNLGGSAVTVEIKSNGRYALAQQYGEKTDKEHGKCLRMLNGLIYKEGEQTLEPVFYYDGAKLYSVVRLTKVK